MTTALSVLGILLVLYVLLNLKTSRPDGKHVGKVHPYRRVLSFIMPTRNESVVYFDFSVNAEKLLAYLQATKNRFECDITQVYVGTCIRMFSQHPKMNLFVVGRRLYMRDGIYVSFSMKRKRLDKEAKVSAVKLKAKEGEDFRQLCERIHEKITYERTDAITPADKEYSLLLALPRPVLNFGVRLLSWLDYHNVLPGAFIESDPLYTGAFISNLGSLGMAPGYHHLFEWGTAAHFFMIGQIEERAVVREGQIVVEKVLPIRCSYDERIDDGLTARHGIDALKEVLADPAKYLGCIAEDGSDRHPLC